MIPRDCLSSWAIYFLSILGRLKDKQILITCKNAVDIHWIVDPYHTNDCLQEKERKTRNSLEVMNNSVGVAVQQNDISLRGERFSDQIFRSKERKTRSYAGRARERGQFDMLHTQHAFGLEWSGAQDGIAN